MVSPSTPRPTSRAAAAFVQSKASSTPTSSQVLVLLNNDDKNEHLQQASTTNHTAIMHSYYSNLRRARRSSSNSSGNNKNAALKPAQSLAHFLANNKAALDDDDDDDNKNLLSESLLMTLIQAIRLATTWNDYRLTIRLVESAMEYATFCNIKLDPRILGEAVRGLAQQTSASFSKIKAVWECQLLLSTTTTKTSCWSRPVSSKEVNAMLEAAMTRGKLRAAIEMLRSFAKIASATDAYSYSIVLQGLKASIEDDQRPVVVALENNGNITAVKNPHLAAMISPSSPCWQWNEAVLLVDELVQQQKQQPQEIRRCLTNPVISALLQMNERTSQVFGKQHETSQNALELFALLKSLRISPDAVTCTLVLSSLQTEWQEALELYHAMPRTQQPPVGWNLPQPNVYIYSAVMAACARNQKYKQVWQLLDELDDDPHVQPNTWIYNTVLQASVKTAQRRPSTSLRKRSRRWMIRLGGERLSIAFQLLERMEKSGLETTAPDTVTYNTLFSALAAVSLYLESEHWNDLMRRYPQHFREDYHTLNGTQAECAVQSLLDRMQEHNVTRDEVTYRHALQSLQGSHVDAVIRILERCVRDLGYESPKIYSTAISVLASTGDLQGVLKIFSLLPATNFKPNSEVTASLIDALSQSKQTGALPLLLDTLGGNSSAALHLENIHGIGLGDVSNLSPVEVSHFSSAISSCLFARDFNSANKILELMKVQQVESESKESLLLDMSRTYALLALDSVSKKEAISLDSKGRRKVNSISAVARTRAESAYSMTKRIGEPPSSLLSIVAKACAATGLFGEAQEILRLVHKRILAYRSSKHIRSRKLFGSSSTPDENELVLPDLQRTLLRNCAEWGNVTFALRFCEDIQYLSRQLSWFENDEDPFFVPRERSNTTELSAFILDPKKYAFVEPIDGPGMKVPEWKSLLVAASKSGHWRVCLSTLQFLKPYLLKTQPMHNSSGSVRRSLGRQYKRISLALNPAVACLADSNQVAWVGRVIHDWIDWSGRRPPLRAVLTAIRALSSQGRTDEIGELLDSSLTPSASLADDGKVYETMLYVGAISALHHDGQYDAADEMFLSAISRGFLPLNLYRQAYGVENRLTLDLHGMNVAVAHSAVRIALQQEVLSTSWNRTVLWDNDMVIVTGRGRKSAARMRPVLRPEVQRMLMEEFYPPLSTTSVPGNMGALRLPSEDIVAWLEHQREQKEAKLLSVATVLKNLSSGERLRAALARAAVSTGDSPTESSEANPNEDD